VKSPDEAFLSQSFNPQIPFGIFTVGDSMKYAQLLISFVLLVSPVAASASQSFTQYCTHWQMGRTMTDADGGVTSTECTCTQWSGSGQQFGCDLCAPRQGTNGVTVQCLQRNSAPLNSGGCSAVGGSGLLGLLAMASLLISRRRKG
jgi:uncharacterized protein (TIGR03382 family)